MIERFRRPERRKNGTYGNGSSKQNGQSSIFKTPANGNGNGHSHAADGDGQNGHSVAANGNGNGNGHHNGRKKIEAFDYLIVGAGYAGSVLAERLARGSGKQVLLVDRRPHIGGNAYDHYDDAGILFYKEGPHIFHTNAKKNFD